MCNGNVLSIQSGSTTMIWLTLPDSFHICPQVLSCGFWFVQQPDTHGRPSFMVVPEIVCSRGCSAAPLTWGMWFHVCTGASGNGCSIAHSVRDLPGEASGLDSQRFEDRILKMIWTWTKLIRRGEGGVGLKLVFCCPNQSLVNDSHFQPPGETGEGALSILVRAWTPLR